MDRLPNFLKSSAIAALAAVSAFAIEVPSGTELQIRLKSKISTQTAKVKDPVESAIIAPVLSDGQVAIPMGAVVRGVIAKTTQSAKGDERSTLQFEFNEIEIDGTKHKLAAQLSTIDNAREKIDDQGQISGILASETITGRLDSGISKLTERFSGFGGVLGTVKNAVLKPAESAITYDAGTEMTLKLTAALTLKGPSTSGPESKLTPIGNDDAVAALVNRQSYRTVAQNPPKPSDITNIMLIASEAQVKDTFAAAGWSLAAGLSTQAKFETFRALAEDRGYQEAPVSILMLDGKPPDMVFEKLNNTFAQRHHLRVFRRDDTFAGAPVWVIAATHDTGISFSEANRTFIHKIDGQIDRERAKVVNDLIFTGRVQSLALVDRPSVPQKDQNATGDSLETDAKMAVLVLK